MATLENEILGVNTEEIATLDLERALSVSGGNNVLAAVTETRAFRTMQSTWIKIDPGESVENYRDCAAAEDIFLLADDTIFLVDGGVAINKQTVDKPRQIFIGPSDDYVTVLSEDGQIQWLDPSTKLQKVGSTQSSEDFPSSDVQITSGYGWTIIGTESNLYCHKEPTNNQSSFIEADLTPIISDASIIDLSFIDGIVVVATTDGVFGLDISTESFKKAWGNRDYLITSLSNPANNQIHGWSDNGVFCILKSGEIELTSAERIYDIKSSHESRLYYLNNSDNEFILERSSEPSVSIATDTIQYHSHSDLDIAVDNKTPNQIKYELDIRTKKGHISVSDENTLNIIVEPFSKRIFSVGEIQAGTETESLDVSIYDNISDSKLVTDKISVDHGTPEIQTETRPSVIRNGDIDFEVRVSNSGTGTARVSFIKNTLSEGYIIPPGESKIILTPTNESAETIYYTGTNPSGVIKQQSIETDWEIPEDAYSVKSGLSQDQNTIRTQIQNNTGVEVQELISIDTHFDEQIKGEITIPPEDQVEIWHSTPTNSTPITPISIEGDGLIRPEHEQLYAHPFLDVERKFFDINGEELREGELPVGERFEERLLIQNDTGETIQKLAISGTKEYYVEEFSPDKKVCLARSITLLNETQGIPSINIEDKSRSASGFSDARSVELSGEWKAKHSQQPNVYAEMFRLDGRTYLSLRIQCEDIQRKFIRLDRLEVSSTEVPLDNTQKRIQTDKMCERTIELNLKTDFQELSPQPVEAVFYKAPSERNIQQSTLAKIARKPTFPSLNPHMRPVNPPILNKQVLSFDSKLSFKGRVKIYNGRDLIKDSRKSFRKKSKTKIRFKSQSQNLRVHVRDIKSGELNIEYKFQQNGNSWEITEQTSSDYFPGEPIVTPWKERD